ncbi:MAG: hypothetical protein PHD32_06825 [Eubacteriales bacterium]|nr:hypothetical protein [Eubacteriales bacterium]
MGQVANTVLGEWMVRAQKALAAKKERRQREKQPQIKRGDKRPEHNG